MFVDDFLLELNALLEDVELEGADELSDVLNELLPELDELCKSLWLLELIVTTCKARK